MEESITTERAHCQRHQESEQKLEAGLFENRYEYHTQQRQEADDGDGHKTPQPDPHWKKETVKKQHYLHLQYFEGQKPGGD